MPLTGRERSLITHSGVHTLRVMGTAGDLDLERYFERIGYDGDRSATTATLNAIAAHHARSIPFENLDPFLGTPNRLDLESLQRKLVESRRGGYCFEQNLLLRAVLLELGFEVTALAARVLWGSTSTDVINPRSHMLLVVDVEGDRRIIDVGFGGMTLDTTLRLETNTVQDTPLEPVRLLDLRGDYLLEALVGDEWRPIYRFDLTPQHPVDYEAPNWYLSTWPGSHFVTGLLAARVAEGRRYALNGTRFTVHPLGGESVRLELTSADELRKCLESEFLIDTSGLRGLDEAFHRLP
jgi:N-hydroxyarylamine O-acetyltransferase